VCNSIVVDDRVQYLFSTNQHIWIVYIYECVNAIRVCGRDSFQYMISCDKSCRREASVMSRE